MRSAEVPRKEDLGIADAHGMENPVDPKTASTSIKTSGFTAFVALLAFAFLATSFAMAETTALCKSDESPCGVGNGTTSLHETSVGNAKLLTALGTVECSVLFASTSVGASGNPQKIEGNFTYTSCTLGGAGCTATEENGPAELQVSREGHEKAKVTGEYLVHLKCGSAIDCSYNGTGLAGTFKGPLLATQTNGEVTISEQSLTKEAGGFLCPKTAKLDITTTPLAATYIVNGAQLSEYLIGVESFAELGVKEEKTSSTGGPATISIPSKSITVECGASTGSGEAFKGGTDESSFSLTKCTVTKGEGCTANETISLKVKTEVIQAGSAFYRKIIAKEGETLGTLTLKGEKCGMSGENKITGAVAAEISLDPQTAEPLNTSEAISKLSNEELKSEGKVELALKVGSQSASLTSEFSQELSGGNAGKEWQNAVGTQLCPNLPANNGRCGNPFGVPTTLKAENEGNYSLVYNRTVTCGELKMEGVTTSVGAAVLAGFSTLTIGQAQCGACVVTPEGGPWLITFTFDANGSGTLRLVNAGLKSVCANETCIYVAAGAPFKFTGGTPAKIESNPALGVAVSMILEAGSAGTCNPTASWEAAGGGRLKFKFPTPGTMYLTP